MGSNLIRCWCVSMLFAAFTLQGEPKTVAGTQDQNVQVIRITARKYEFAPSQVRVKQGTPVQLKIRAIDRDHGLKIAMLSDGADGSSGPGLEFMPPQDNNGWKLKKNKETTIEFVAKTAGVYEFRCSVACGIHHGRMKGRLVVEP